MTGADAPYEGIIAAAKKQKCDVIFMASHGRRGLSKLLMGSVTQEVLTRQHGQVRADNPKETLWNTSMSRATVAR